LPGAPAGRVPGARPGEGEKNRCTERFSRQCFGSPALRQRVASTLRALSPRLTAWRGCGLRVAGGRRHDVGWAGHWL